MRIQEFTFNMFQENTFIIWDKSNSCIIIDPGCYSEKEEEVLISFIEKNDLIPEKLVNTHCHIDHILGNKVMSEKWGLDLYMHKDDISLLNNAKNIANMYGFNNYQEAICNRIYLSDGDKLTFGESELEILFTPGHSPGHICLLNKKGKFIIAGDVLFNGSVGRTDLRGGDFDTLIKSIRKRLLSLEEDTIVYCGHGPSTTIGKEKATNPFLQ